MTAHRHDDEEENPRGQSRIPVPTPTSTYFHKPVDPRQTPFFSKHHNPLEHYTTPHGDNGTSSRSRTIKKSNKAYPVSKNSTILITAESMLPYLKITTTSIREMLSQILVTDNTTTTTAEKERDHHPIELHLSFHTLSNVQSGGGSWTGITSARKNKTSTTPLIWLGDGADLESSYFDLNIVHPQSSQSARIMTNDKNRNNPHENNWGGKDRSIGSSSRISAHLYFLNASSPGTDAARSENDHCMEKYSRVMQSSFRRERTMSGKGYLPRFIISVVEEEGPPDYSKKASAPGECCFPNTVTVRTEAIVPVMQLLGQQEQVISSFSLIPISCEEEAMEDVILGHCFPISEDPMLNDDNRENSQGWLLRKQHQPSGKPTGVWISSPWLLASSSDEHPHDNHCSLVKNPMIYSLLLYYLDQNDQQRMTNMDHEPILLKPFLLKVLYSQNNDSNQCYKVLPISSPSHPTGMTKPHSFITWKLLDYEAELELSEAQKEVVLHGRFREVDRNTPQGRLFGECIWKEAGVNSFVQQNQNMEEEQHEQGQKQDRSRYDDASTCDHPDKIIICQQKEQIEEMQHLINHLTSLLHSQTSITDGTQPPAEQQRQHHHTLSIPNNKFTNNVPPATEIPLNDDSTTAMSPKTNPIPQEGSSELMNNTADSLSCSSAIVTLPIPDDSTGGGNTHPASFLPPTIRPTDNKPTPSFNWTRLREDGSSSFANDGSLLCGEYSCSTLFSKRNEEEGSTICGIEAKYQHISHFNSNTAIDRTNHPPLATTTPHHWENSTHKSNYKPQGSSDTATSLENYLGDDESFGQGGDDDSFYANLSAYSKQVLQAACISSAKKKKGG